MLGLTKVCEIKAGSTVTFDNLFTSLPLLDELTWNLELVHLALFGRTVSMAPLYLIKLAKKPRGSYDFVTIGKNLVVS